MSRRQGVPVLIRMREGSQQLARVPLTAREFDEEYIQSLIFEHPGCLPIGEIEPGLLPFLSVCREMPTRHGPIDNLLMNGDGDIAIVEAKLWRNSEARRQVIAQALDYASCLFEMGYSEFEASALKGIFGARPTPPSLYSLFDKTDGLEESQFVDAVSANLSRGRIIILVAGDGIRSETERLASALHSHAGFHFTFALVELAVFRLPTSDDVLVVPNTLAQTRIVERGIVRIEQGTREARILPPAAAATSTVPISGSISAEQFFEAMAARDPRLPDGLRKLIAGFEEFGAYPEFRRALNLKWDGPTRTYNLGIIQRDGQVWTDANSPPIEAGHRYIEAFASVVGGEVEKNKMGGRWYVTLRGKAPRAEQFLDNFKAWTDVARSYVERLRASEAAAE